MKITKQILKKINHFDSELLIFWSINLALVTFQLFYIVIRYQYLNLKIPLDYSMPWGDSQLVYKRRIFLLPILSIIFIPLGTFFYYKAKQYFFLYANNLIITAIGISNFLLTVSLVRIINIASSPFKPLVPEAYLTLLFPFTASFVATYYITPFFIEKFKEKNIVTNPKLHLHPGMLLKRPTARGGGLVFAIIFVALCIILVGVSKILIGIYASVLILALIGIIDDYQNTNVKSFLRFFENPLLRLVLLGLVVLIPIFLGIRIDFINNPFNGIYYFGNYTITLGDYTIAWASVIFTAVWFVWILNVLSWSNGVDGQYGGIVGVALITVAFLALRFADLELIHLQVAKMAIIASGIAWGITKFNWYPSKILWGFGAMSIGLVLATTSVLIGGKVAISAMVILIPFLDAGVTIARRIIRGKNPLKADRGHLHHLLHKAGWGFRRISIFYWFTTGIFGLLALLSANKDTALLLITVMGLVGFAVIVIHVGASVRNKSNS